MFPNGFMPIMNIKLYLLIVLFLISMVNSSFSQRKMEKLNRGLVAVPKSKTEVYLSWRILSTDADDISFNIYKKIGDTKLKKLNNNPILYTSDFVDAQADFTVQQSYFVKPIINGKEVGEYSSFELKAHIPIQQYLSVPLQIPPAGEVFGEKFHYTANDASVADLDGDGIYEIILKWEPSNSKNPPQKGFTGNQLIDAYKMDGTLLWRIDLGVNIRSGAAYTQFLVYDLDGDGKAELVCKTADGTIDGLGKIIGEAGKDWRFVKDKDDPKYGKIVDGPEYLTVFDGLTGAALATANYEPNRYPLDGWGGGGGNGRNDNSGSRSDRFTACIAYLDGINPSIVMVRGWYGRSVLAAWDFKSNKLNQRWIFDSKNAENPYSGMGNHQLTVADVDNDGRDEICIGAMTVDDDGAGLYTTGLRHGDAMHLSDLDPTRPGLEVYGIHESEGRAVALNTPGVALFDAKTGEVIWSLFPGKDVGRGVAADIDPTHIGFENWGGPGGLRNIKGQEISKNKPSSTNFLVWWDDDLSRELLDKNYIDKWDWENQASKRLFTAEGAVSNNGTKATPCLSADIFGDWREEVIWRSADNKELRIYTTTIPAKSRMVTLMQDPQYRLSVVWQNVAYNQPPHPSFYLGNGMSDVDKKRIKYKEIKDAK
jgi:rhamnogalacturonan endolyase